MSLATRVDEQADRRLASVSEITVKSIGLPRKMGAIIRRTGQMAEALGIGGKALNCASFARVSRLSSRSKT